MNIWIKELLNNLDKKVDESTRKAIMGACGEKCPFTHLSDEKLSEIKEKSKNEKAFLNSLCKHWYLKNQNGQYYVIFVPITY